MTQIWRWPARVHAHCLWCYYLAVKALTPMARRRPAEEQARRDIGAVRDVLRKCPFWIRGHLILGRLELHRTQIMSEPPSARAIAAIRISGEAALMILEQEGAVSPDSPLLVRAKFLLAMGLYLQQDYEQALSVLTAVTAWNNALRLPRSEQWLSLETAGACALALGDRAKAFECFSQVPSQALTPQSQQLIKGLKGR